MIPLSIGIAESALTRKESRGAHVRLDYPQRDDANWLKNVVIRKNGKDSFDISLKPVKLTKLKPSFVGSVKSFMKDREKI